MLKTEALNLIYLDFIIQLRHWDLFINTLSHLWSFLTEKQLILLYMESWNKRVVILRPVIPSCYEIEVIFRYFNSKKQCHFEGHAIQNLTSLENYINCYLHGHIKVNDNTLKDTTLSIFFLPPFSTGQTLGPLRAKFFP